MPATERDTCYVLIRIFRGQARDGMQDLYARYLRDIAAPQILSHPGARDLQILDPLRDRDDFVVETVWDDLASLISFAGDEWARPRIAPAEAEMISQAAVSHHRPAPVSGPRWRRVRVSP